MFKALYSKRITKYLSNMISFLSNFLNYVLPKNHNDTMSDSEKEQFLASELLELEIKAEQEQEGLVQSTFVKKELTNASCFHKTGIVTDCGDNYILIDGTIYYELTGSSSNLNVNDKIAYLGYKNSNGSIKVVRILENHGAYWGGEIDSEEKIFDIFEHILIGQVANRKGRLVFMVDSDLKFNLDDVEGSFVPTQGDWLELKCSVHQNSKKLTNISPSQVLEVISFNCTKKEVKSAIVTECTDMYGICNKQIYYNSSTIIDGPKPGIGCKVIVEAIESSHGACIWRALKLLVINDYSPKNVLNESQNEEIVSRNLEEEKGIEMTHPLSFKDIRFDATGEITVNIKNTSTKNYIINRWIILSKKRDSQLVIKPFIDNPIALNSEETFNLKITCIPKFLGNTKECLVILFKGFQLKRFITISVVDNTELTNVSENNYKRLKESEKIEAMKKVINKRDVYVPGVKLYKPPAFVAVKIGFYPIPDKIWGVVLGDSYQMIHTNEFNKVLHRIEKYLPFMSQKLNISNYTDKWHTLIYMEEVQANVNMRIHDRSKVNLIRCQDYLAVEMCGLSEKRPSLIKGDKVIVKDVWNEYATPYEGFIHEIRGDLVLAKFNPLFQEMYSGFDVSVEFHFSRTVYRRSHHAINLAISNLGPNILFPHRVTVKSPQISQENIDKLSWFNKNLNDYQKRAVINIVKGECRPLPYIIFGPPGTGKTITVIETILQILKLVPESRILVATPSNSAANLVTERLLEYKESLTVSIVRLIANYLVDSAKLPETIRPYCATLDIAEEKSRKSNYTVRNKVHINCQKSYIGRHRVTIGTCSGIGALKHLDFSQGHFTHIIVDEAGQATEPEVMLPITFADKNHGQIILAGDPMQLGPVILSPFCKEYGMEDSFLCRLLERSPYLKDYESFQNGFDDRLVTKLNDNYRSLDEVITLSNQLFYDGTLEAKVDKNLPRISELINATCEIFDTDSKTGGIFVCGIQGQNLRSDDGPSWYNPQEAAMLALTVCKLYKRNVAADEIGIITPYIAQTKYFWVLFESMGLKLPKIGTVEEFQGQERAIILISTVRSIESKEDIQLSLGFVRNPKRMNVALTRAKVATLLFCNPHILALDPLWNKAIKYAVTYEKYMGCDLPYECNT